ncbi:Glycerophosphoryl diester phosphodiesterase, membrane domain protein, partial [gut metagenome]
TYIIASLLVSVSVIIGLALFILPGIYIIIRLQFFLPFITEENCGAIESLKRSWEITRGAELPLFIFLACVIGFLSLGLILLIVGVFVTIPLISLAYANLFRKLNRPFPDLILTLS